MTRTALPTPARESAAQNAQPLHVAIPLGGCDLGHSGIGTYFREVLPPFIARVARDGGRTTVFGHPGELEAFAASLTGAGVRALPEGLVHAGANAAWHLLRSGAYARRLGADVLLLPAANRRIASTRALPTVAIVHDMAQLRVERKYDPLRMFYFKRVLLPAFRRPTELVAVSAATRSDLVRTLGLAARRVRVVHNGVDTLRFRRDLDPETVSAAQVAAGLNKRRYLLYPARLEHPGKNHVRLLHAFARSGLAGTHVLALSGRDWGAGAMLEALAKELGIARAVRFLGFVSTDALASLVLGAEAVLMLGLHEGFGLPPLEALSAGRPVCVSNTGALPEVVGALGVQCDPLDENAIADALRRVLFDSNIRARCTREGPAWAAQFTWSNTAEGLFQACVDAHASWAAGIAALPQPNG